MSSTSPAGFTTPFLIADLVQAPKGSWDSIGSFTLVNGAPASAALEIQSSSGCLLIPRLNATQVNNLIATNGMVVYNTTLNAFRLYQGGAWQSITTINYIDTSEFGNFFMGTNAGNAIATGTENTSFGNDTLSHLTSGTGNTAFGTDGLNSNLDGNGNTAMGVAALFSNASGSENSSFGNSCLENNTNGNSNSAYGNSALFSNIIGNNNSAFGVQALLDNTASSNCAFGVSSLQANTNGTNNCAFGFQSGMSASTASGNSSFGNLSLLNNTASSISAFGYQTLQNNTGANNSAFGYQCLAANTSGAGNTGFGYLSLNSNLTGNFNTAFGKGTLQNTTGSDGSAFGYHALQLNTSGAQNSAFGFGALASNVSGNSSTAFGYQCLEFSTANSNTGFGSSCLAITSSGTRNVGIGDSVLIANVTGSDNTGAGYQALFTQTGSGTTAVGKFAGSQFSYTNCSFFGASADAGANNLTNATAIGYSAVVTASNSLVLGNGVNVGIGTTAPNNTLHIVGTYQQKGIVSGYTGSDLIKGQVSLQTTDATVHTILSVPLSTSPQSLAFINLSTLVINVNGSEHAGLYGEVAGGTGVGVMINNITNTNDFPAAAPTLTAAVSGSNLLLQAAGIAATTLNWVLSYQYFSVTTSTA